MTEVDEIEAALRGPTEAWLNNVQLVDFYRLIQIARRAEQAEDEVRRMRDLVRQPAGMSDDPQFHAERNRPGTSY